MLSVGGFELTPAFLLVAPVVLLAISSRRWALGLAVLSVPFFELDLFHAVSHPFNLPEISMVVIALHYLQRWLRSGRLRLPNGRPLLWLLMFGLISTVSVIYLVLLSPEVMVRPYNAGPFSNFEFVPARVNSNNISQLLLRWFFVLSVLLLALELDTAEKVRWSIKAVLFGAVLTGAVGIVHQVSFLWDVEQFFRLYEAVGFRRISPGPGTLGPIPRMWSFPGEPGYVADYLLYAFALTATFTVSRSEDPLFSRRTAGIVTATLLGLLVLSTGTTGYGGLLIFVGVLTFASFLFKGLSQRYVMTFLTSGAIAGMVGVGVVSLAGIDVLPVIAEQAQKMSFQQASGSTRLQYMLRSLSVVRHRPLLGVGAGSHYTPSLLATLVAEVGLIGFVCFGVAHLLAYRRCIGLSHRGTTSPLAAMAFVAGLTLFLTNLVAKSVVTLLFPWYWFGLAFPIAVVANEIGRETPPEKPKVHDKNRN